MSITAKLKVILMVDDASVAESENPKLWQEVFDAIRKESLSTDKSTYSTNENLLLGKGSGTERGETNDLIRSFAKKIGVSEEVLIGACSPSSASPYIHLDKHHWETLKKSASIAKIVISATILAAWKEHIKATQTTRKEAQSVLKTIGLYDKAIPRGLRNCEWLQVRGDNIQINPAQTSKAIELVRAYCQKDAPEFARKSE